MKKLLYILILLSVSRHITGQTFKQYKQTYFYYASADKALKGQITLNAYIKKADTILILSKADLNESLTLFEKNPSSFVSLFQNLPWIGTKNNMSDNFDKILKSTDYKKHAEIDPIVIFEREEEVTWNITNSDYTVANPSCYSSIIFTIKDKTATNKININNLEYLKVLRGYCDY